MNVSFSQKLLFFQSDFTDAVQSNNKDTKQIFLFLPVLLVLLISVYVMNVYDLSHTKNHFNV